MPGIQLTQITNDSATIEAPITGLDTTLTVTFRPSAYTPESEARFVAADKGDVRSEAAVEMLHNMLISWGLESDGQPVGIDADTLRTLPLFFLADVIVAISENLAGKVESQGGLEGPTSAGT